MPSRDMTIFLAKKSSNLESCMNCGEVGTKFVDNDGSHFCKKSCAEYWHGIDLEISAFVVEPKR